MVLGLLSAIGPFAIDMYLPALPTIGGTFGVTIGEVQATLMAFFVALGLGQMVYGPLSDMYGRKLPLYAGLTLFMVASVGCALAPSIQSLVAWRFVQGLGACVGMVIPRAVVRDLHTGPEAAKLMAQLMLVFSVSPILAPLTGSFLIENFGWRSVFWAVLVATGLALVLLRCRLPETRPPAERAGSTVAAAVSAYGLLLRDRHFLALVCIGAFSMASFFAYLANSSFVLIDHHGLSPRQYSVAFAANAASFIGVSQFAGPLARRLGLRRVVRIGVACNATIMLSLLGLQLVGVTGLAVLLALLFVGFGFLGMVVPTTAVLALDGHGPIAGTASALMGTLQFLTGVAVMAAVGVWADGTALPMVAGIATAAVLAWVFALNALPREAVARRQH